MATPLETLLEEKKFAEEAGDLDKVAEIDAMIQLHFGNEIPRKKKGGVIKSSSKKTKKGSTLRGVGIAKRGFRKAKIR